jgi:hypothetical protein
VNLPAFVDELFPQDIAAMLKGRLTFKEAIDSSAFSLMSRHRLRSRSGTFIRTGHPRGMTPAVEKFRQRIQKELGLTVGPKDPLLALWVAQQEFLEETAAEYQKLLAEFEAALGRNQTIWIDQAKGLANQSLNGALRAARDSTMLLVEEAARTNAGAVRAAAQEGIQRLEQARAVSRRIAWVSLAASIAALAASVGLVLARLPH